MTAGGMYWQAPGQLEKGPAQGYRYRYYRADDTESTVEVTKEEVAGVNQYAAGLEQRLQALQHPDGSPYFPAKTCKDLRNCYNANEDREYVLDPNGGCPGDSFKANCEFKPAKTETCIKPNTELYKKINSTHITGEAGKSWMWFFGEIADAGNEFSFAADTVQLRYMRMNSMHARQQITIHCKNMHVHKNTNGHAKKRVKVMSDDDLELSAHNEHTRKKMTVIEDGCQKKDGQWHKTVLEYSSKSTERLPIRDVAFHLDPAHFTDASFAIEVGPICFTQDEPIST